MIPLTVKHQSGHELYKTTQNSQRKVSKLQTDVGKRLTRTWWMYAHTHTRDSAAEVDVVRAGSSHQNLWNWLKWNTAIHSWQVKITKFWETRSIHQRRLSSAGERRIWSALLSEWRSACDPAPTLNPSCFQTTLVFHHKTEFNHQNGLITRDKRQVEIRAAETPALQMIELGSRSARHLKKWVMWQCSSRVFSVVTRMLFWSF